MDILFSVVLVLYLSSWSTDLINWQTDMTDMTDMTDKTEKTDMTDLTDTADMTYMTDSQINKIFRK